MHPPNVSPLTSCRCCLVYDTLNRIYDMTRFTALRIIVYFCGLIAGGPRLQAQVSAALSGTVTDPSGALVQGATVTVKDIDTGATRSAITDGSGHYQASALPVGQYEIRAGKPGFTTVLRTGIRLVVGQNATVDLRLQVGDTNQQVTVNADAALVTVTTTDISGLVGQQQIRDLPLNGRSFDELLTLNPGVVNFTWQKT